ncbi:protein phosphatase 1M isoform X1 [Microcaecilia unicolor]|uniref:Protein phosphatase 1M isoform X1 n=1 Tax=Microcaecilia unicolor TaxID=1415580 RepID=A0A6P7YHJ7_9AMPH|nr:protein phosphatase 1M isoform X1 [Microcaecilia unicolor]
MSLVWLKKYFSFESGRATAGEGEPVSLKTEQEPNRLWRQSAYRRPRFLDAIWREETEADSRSVYSTPEDRPLLWNSGYAEVINSQKSHFNEDQAVCCQISARKKERCQWEEAELLVSCDNYVTSCYWALFDGHGGPVAAILASSYLQCCIKHNLEWIMEGLTGTQPPMHLNRQCIYQSDPQLVEAKGICHDHLVIGALENAFRDCDEMICQEMLTINQSGGCTALIALYLHGKLFVANAGDSRAIIIKKQSILQLSNEFTPETERQRLQYLAFIYPEYLADEFTRFEFPRRLKRKDLGQKVLYRDYCMAGWGYKMVERDDLKYPLVHGQGKQARLLGTLAVSRCLGDHQLKVAETNIAVKPFLSSIPEVKVLDFAKHGFLKDDVLVMATDGLWDVLSNEEVAQVVRSFLDDNRLNPCRFLELAKHLVYKARGTKNGTEWLLDTDTPASYDDISVFVIPLWDQNCLPRSGP